MKINKVNTTHATGVVVENAEIVISHTEAKFLYHAIYAMQTNLRGQLSLHEDHVVDNRNTQDNLMLVDKMKIMLMPTLREILVPKLDDNFLDNFDPVEGTVPYTKESKKQYKTANPNV